MLALTDFDETITVDALTQIGVHDTAGERFRYWRLRYRLAMNDGEVPLSIPPAADTPAANRITRDAPAHSNQAAIRASEQIDSLVRQLAWVDGRTSKRDLVSNAEAWSVIEGVLDNAGRRTASTSASHEIVAQRAPGLARTGSEVAANYSGALPQRMSDELGTRYRRTPERWDPTLLLDIAVILKTCGADVLWEEQVFDAYEAGLLSQNVHQKLSGTADLIERQAEAGHVEEAKRLVRSLHPLSFAVGFRKDRQFEEWVEWIGRSLAEPAGQRFVPDADWLARLLAAVEPKTESAPRTAAAALSAAIARADPMSAIYMCEYLVRRGMVWPPDVLAALVLRIVEDAGHGDAKLVYLAADITSLLLFSIGNEAYPEVTVGLLNATQAASGPGLAEALANSIVVRSNAIALATTRSGWRAALGMPPFPEEGLSQEEERDQTDDFFALLLNDGSKISPKEVLSQAQSVDDILSLRREESTNSHFRWAPVIAGQSFGRGDTATLVEEFAGDEEADPEVVALLASKVEENGAQGEAHRLAGAAFERARGDTWSRAYGGTRLSATEIIVRTGEAEDCVKLCQDLAYQARAFSWLPRQLIQDFDEIIQAFQLSVSASSIWPDIRIYLDGMADVLVLSNQDPLRDKGSFWWLSSGVEGRHGESCDSSPGDALAELAVRHLAHPAYIIRDSAAAIVVRALGTGSEDVA